MKPFQDVWLLFRHHLGLTLQNPVLVMVGLFQPICELLLFAPLLEPVTATAGFPPGGALIVFVPGLLVLLGVTSSLFVVFGFIAEIKAGVLERMRVTTVSRVALVLGRSLRDVLMLLLQSLALLGTAWFMGLRADPLGVVVSLFMVALLGLGVSSCSYALALVFRDENAVSSLLNFLILPVLLLSGITLPLTLAPEWIRQIAIANPFAHAVDAARALFIGQVHDTEVWIGFAVMIMLAIVGIGWAARSFRQSVA